MGRHQNGVGTGTWIGPLARRRDTDLCKNVRTIEVFNGFNLGDADVDVAQGACEQLGPPWSGVVRHALPRPGVGGAVAGIEAAY